MGDESKFAEEREQIFKAAIKKLMSKIELICDDYEGSLVRLFNGPMGMNISRTQVHGYFTSNLMTNLEDAVLDMFRITNKNVGKIVEEESLLLKKHRDKSSPDALDESKKGTLKRVEYTILNSDVILLNQAKNKHMRRIGDTLDELRRAFPDIRHYEGRVEDLVADTFGMVKKACERTLEDITYDITRSSDKHFDAVINGKKDINGTKRASLPPELLENVKRILSLAGYNLIIDGDTFLATSQDKKELHIIEFDETYHIFQFADAPSKGNFCVAVSKDGKNSSDIYVSDSKAISFNIQNGALTIRDDKKKSYYGINATGSDAVAMIYTPEMRKEVDPILAMEQMDTLFPGVSDAYYKVIGKKKEELNKDNQNKNGPSYPGYL